MGLLASARARVADLIFPEGREQRDMLAREANVDALTGVANRRALDLALRSAERDAGTRVVLFDADNFGQVNKTCGHARGDELLVELARSIERAASRFGYGVRVFRRGGDEFVVLASEATARLIRDEAEVEFGEREACRGVRVSLTGTVGRTLGEADAALQGRKDERRGGSGRGRNHGGRCGSEAN